MTVAELRKALEGVPDEMMVLVYDEGYLTEEVTAKVWLAKANIPGQALRTWSQKGGCTPWTLEDGATPYFLIS